MSNYLSKTAVLKKKLNCKLKLQQRILVTNFGVVNVLKFLQTLVLDFPIFVCNYCLFTDKKEYKVVLAHAAAYNTLNFYR